MSFKKNKNKSGKQKTKSDANNQNNNLENKAKEKLSFLHKSIGLLEKRYSNKNDVILKSLAQKFKEQLKVLASEIKNSNINENNTIDSQIDKDFNLDFKLIEQAIDLKSINIDSDNNLSINNLCSDDNLFLDELQSENKNIEDNLGALNKNNINEDNLNSENLIRAQDDKSDDSLDSQNNTSYVFEKLNLKQNIIDDITGDHEDTMDLKKDIINDVSNISILDIDINELKNVISDTSNGANTKEQHDDVKENIVIKYTSSLDELNDKDNNHIFDNKNIEDKKNDTQNSQQNITINDDNKNIKSDTDDKIETQKEKIDEVKSLKKAIYGEPHILCIRGRKINLYINSLATQSNMSIILNYKSLSLLFTVDISKDIDDQNSSFVVHFMTKSYAFSKIPNNPTRRENSKTSERDILISRLIDRSIRPLINKNFNLGCQLICTLLSYPTQNLISEADEFFDIEFFSVLGSCIAMYLSSIPLNGLPIPIRIIMKNNDNLGSEADCNPENILKSKKENEEKNDLLLKDNNYQNIDNQLICDKNKNKTHEDDQIICFPFMSELNNFTMDLFVSFNNNELIMIEAESKEINYNKFIKAVDIARESIKNIEIFIKALGNLYKKDDIVLNDENSKLKEIIIDEFSNKIFDLLFIQNKVTRNINFEKLYKEIKDFLSINHSDLIYTKHELDETLLYLKRKNLFKKIQKTNKRIDGRSVDEIREIDCETNLPFMESSHGSSIFRRKAKKNFIEEDIINLKSKSEEKFVKESSTTALVSCVLGTMYDEQIIEGFESDRKERFILHYNFLPYATGDAYQLKNTNRREIGHGRLAFKALKNLLPEKKIFPYTFRLCSEILSCDGSSSMATICASSMAMIDAGIPLKECVAGIAVGLLKDPDDKLYNIDNIYILSDIIGDEDHIGNMDFKVAGTKNGITALQMDVKDFGIKDSETFERVLISGKNSYLKVLDKMLDENFILSKLNIKKNTPSIIQIVVDKSYVKSIIGNRGETIKAISEMTGAKIDIDSSSQENATINIFGPTKKSVSKAEKIIQDLILQPEVGKIYDGTIDKITDFGIFVKFLNDKIRGLIHERNCEGDRYDFYNRKKNLKIGDSIKIKVLFISGDGKVGLSIVEDNQSSQAISDQNYMAQENLENNFRSESIKDGLNLDNFNDNIKLTKLEKSNNIISDEDNLLNDSIANINLSNDICYKNHKTINNSTVNKIEETKKEYFKFF
jgi:polyribonucleotide nucleotidyltransferase